MGRLCLDNPKLGGERKVYAALQKHLSDEYTVLYGAHFCLGRGGGGQREKEIDFLVLHKERGIVAVEVKGGIIKVENGRWTSTDRNGQVHEIKNPGEQVAGSSHDLTNKLKSLPKWPGGNIQLGYGVVFPDCVGDRIRDKSIPNGCLLDEGGLDRIDTFIETVQKAHRRQFPAGTTKSSKWHDVLIENFAPSFETRVPNLLRTIREGEEHVVHFSEQQFMLLDFIKDRTRGRIMGQAGTGKSVLALEAARRFSNLGMRTLYVCFNRALAAHLRTAVSDSLPGLEIYTYHHLCSSYAERYGVHLPKHEDVPPADHGDYFLEKHTDALLAAMDKTESEADRYDAIVVDEAQDFEDYWWESLQLILKDHEEGAMYIFHDDTQGIFREVPSFLKDIDCLGRLDKNYRNAIPIHELMKRRFDVKTEGCGPDTTMEIQWREMQPDQKAPSAVANSLKHLIENERIPPGEIAVLTGCSLQKTPVGNGGHIGGIRVTENPSEGRKVLLSSIHSFKGLDRTAVIMCELDSLLKHDRDDVLYVGVSRARQYLEIVGSAEVIVNLRGTDATSK